jgi:hypothetical protein
MHDQIRITVVATGFDQTKQRLQQFVAPHYQRQPTPEPLPNPFVTHGSASSYQDDSVQQEESRQEEQQQTVSSNPPPQQKESEEDEWDIPAFLRQRN